MAHFTTEELFTYINITNAARWPKCRRDALHDGYQSIMAVVLACKDGYLADIGAALDAKEAELP